MWKRFRTRAVPVFLSIMVLSCAGGPQTPQPAANQAQSEKPAPAPKKAPEAPKPAVKQEAAYPASGEILAAIPSDSDSFSYAKFHLAKITTEASAQTKNEYEVALIAYDANYGKGQKIWTSKVIRKTHRPLKDELKAGLVVLFPVGEHRWSRAVVTSIDELYKGTVGLQLYWGAKPDNYDRTSTAKLEHLLVSDDPVFESPRK